MGNAEWGMNERAPVALSEAGTKVAEATTVVERQSFWEGDAPAEPEAR